MPTLIKNLLLDFDGTLVNSLPSLKLAFTDLLQTYSIELDAYQFSDFNGPTISEIITTIHAEQTVQASVKEMLSCYHDIIDHHYQGIEPSVGAKPLLLQAKKQGWTAIIVTSNNKPRVAKWLSKNQLEGFIFGIVDANAVKRSKPNPEPYLSALALASCEAKSAVAVEDSIQGIRSAQAAGIKTFGLRNDETQAVCTQAEFKAVHWIDSLMALPKVFWKSTS